MTSKPVAPTVNDLLGDGCTHHIDIDGRPVAVVAADTDRARHALTALTAMYPARDDMVDTRWTVVALGGDGFLLRTCHAVAHSNLDSVVFGVNLGTVGFLSNGFSTTDELAGGIGDRIANARTIPLTPLHVDVATRHGRTSALAFNDVSLLRATSQAVHLDVSAATTGGTLRVDHLVGDGLIVSTPAGSTGYARSAGGSVLPLGSDAIELVALAPYAPTWAGAVLPGSTTVTVDVADPQRRRVLCSVDHLEFRDVTRIAVTAAHEHVVTLGFDPGHELDVRLLASQFPPQQPSAPVRSA